MSAPTRTHGRPQAAWDRMCLDKVRFTDEYVARARAQQILADGKNTPWHGLLWVYHCPNCKGWHMTKKRWNQPLPPVSAADLFVEDADDHIKRVRLGQVA